jgi:autotransporter-associated beta strand protein
MLRWALAIGALSIALGARTAAAQSDPVGYNALLASFSAAGLPAPGTGVVVEQVEANINQTPPPLQYMPDKTQGYFSGVTFTDETGGGGVSSHATNVGSFWYASYGYANGITQVDVYEANDWLANFLRVESFLAPISAPSNHPAVANFSWVGGGTNVTSDNDTLRRLDYVINRDNLVAVTAVGNLPYQPTIPPILAVGYNSIAVGLGNAQSPAGPVPSNEAGLDGPGRCKPDIVAPSYEDSYALPEVSAAAAMLVQVAKSKTALSSGTNAAVVKAILMAGTDKNPLSTWSHTPTRPLDLQYGAGQLNFNWDYQILTAGPQTASTTSLAASTGWSYSSVNPGNSSGNTQTYFFQVPSGQPFDLSSLLTWQRNIITGGGSPLTLTPSLGTLNLNLYQANSNFTLGSLIDSSSSSIDNVQYVFDRGLPPGEYALQVKRTDTIPGPWNYALAWQMQAVPYWITGNGSWNNAANWNNDLVAGGVGREAALFAPTVTGVNVTLDAPQTVGLLTLANTASASTGYTISTGTGGSLTFSNSGSSSQLNITSGSHVISAPVTLASNLTVAPASGAVLNVSGNISGSGALTDSGPGALILTGSNTYGGTTTISAGTLQLGTGGNLGAGTVVDNSVLELKHLDTFTLSNSVSGTGALAQSGTGTAIVIGTNTYSGGTRVNGGNLSFSSLNSLPASGTVLINQSGAVNVTGAYSTVTGWLTSGRINTASSGALALALVGSSNESINMGGFPQLSLGAASPGTTYSGVLTPAGTTYYLGGGGGKLTFIPNLTGARGLIVDNPGTVVLTGTNTYSGSTTVTNGVLEVFKPSSIPGGNLNIGFNLSAFGLGAPVLPLSDPPPEIGGGIASPPVTSIDAAADPTSALLTLNNSSVSPAAIVPGGVTSVPEPGALAMLLSTGLSLLAWRTARLLRVRKEVHASLRTVL